MKDTKQEEMITLQGEWNRGLLHDTINVSEQRLKKFPPIPINAKYNFYNIEGHIIVQKSATDNESISSNKSSTSSSSSHLLY